MKSRRMLLVLASPLAAALAFAVSEQLRSAPVEEPAPISARVQREGIAFDLSIVPRGGTAASTLAETMADVRLTITDAATGAPLRGLRPLVWLSRDRGMPPPLDDASCRERIRGHLGGFLAARPDVDLNGYLVLTLNDGNALSVINPQIAFGRTKLEQILTLSGRPEDWALTPDGERLFVTLPTVDRVAAIDTRRLRILGNVDAGDRPTAIAVAPDGRTAWVANDGDGSVTVIDVESSSARIHFAGPSMRNRFAFHAAGGTAWVIGEGARTIDVHDVDDGARITTVDLGAPALAIVASEAARAVYVATFGGRLLEIDADRRAIAQAIELGAPADRLAVDPSGRWIFAASSQAGSLVAVDASASRVSQRWEGLGEPDAIAFSEDFVYVRDRGEPRIFLLARAALGTASGPAIVEVPLGRRAPAAAAALSQASPFADTPEPKTMLVAHPADRALYLYREGMMAPAGTHLNYGREARAALVLDRSLRERAPGRHETVAMLRGGGSHTVALLLESPRIATCFRIAIDGVFREAPPPAPPLRVERIGDASTIAPGREAELRFRLADALGEAPRGEAVHVLIHRTPTNQQWRLLAADDGGGAFRVVFTPPVRGRYRLLAAIPDRSIGFGDLPPIEFTVDEPPARLGRAVP